MQTRMKRFIGALLALCMCLVMVPVQVRAIRSFYWPISTGYGITTGYYAYSNHNGVDMAAPSGTPVYAVHDGTAVFYQAYTTINGVDYLTSFGNFVRVTSSDGSYQTEYCHFSAFEGVGLVIPSDRTKQQSGSSGRHQLASKTVKEGDLLGYVGTTGNSTGPHLHFGLKISGTYADPTGYLDQSKQAGSGGSGDSGGGSTAGSNPKGVWDEVSGGTNSVFVRGWAYDPDDLNAALEMHVYVGGVHRGTLTANSGRPDVNSAEGCGDYHGFEGTIALDSSITGSQTVEVFALNVGGGSNASLGTKTVTINGSGSSNSSSTDPVGNLETASGGVLSLKLVGWAYDPDDTSQSVVLHVYAQGEYVGAVTANKSRQDVHDQTGAGVYHGFDATLPIPPHLAGTPYVAIYMLNIGGGGPKALTGQVVTIKSDTTAPVISDAKVTDCDPTGYTVSCTVTDNCGVDRVQFPSWTKANEQDDLVSDWSTNTAVSGTKNGNTYTFRVKTSAHNNEAGEYQTHIYAYDESGNHTSVTHLTATVPAAASSVSLSANTLNFDTLGSAKTLTAKVLPSNALQNISWSVSDSTVATVNGGVVTAIGYGTAVVKATAHNGVSATCTVTVERPVITGVSVATMPGKTVYTVGDTLDPTGLTLTARYSNGAEETVTEGFSCDPTVLDTVGTQTITVTYAGFTTSFQVVVEEPPTVASGVSGALTWELTDDGVLTFSGSGKMKNYSYKSEMPWYGYMDRITAVVLEEGVASIGDYAFYGMKALETITIAETVTSIGSYAFKNCPVLDGVVLPAGLNKLGESAFYACTGLTAMEIPASLWTVQPYTFKNCTALTELTLHEGNLMKISDGAFYNTGLTDLVLPDCLAILDVYAFKNCTSLESITLGSGLTQIREAVFYATAIPAITIPEGVVSVGPYAFKNCTNLRQVDLPGTLTSIGEASFYACTALKDLDIPDAVTRINDYAFRKCADLQAVTFSDSLVCIGESAFYGCESLFYLNIPEKVTTIGGYAFKGCTGLGIVSLPDGLITLGESAFYGCTGLTEFEIPANVKTVGDYCFSRSTGLRTVWFLGDAPQIGTGAFSKVTAEAYYPGGNATWTSAVKLNYGGTITWIAQ